MVLDDDNNCCHNNNSNSNNNNNNNNRKTCELIDMAVPSDRNRHERPLKSSPNIKELEIEITRMRGMKTEIIPVVIGTLGLIKKGLEKHT